MVQKIIIDTDPGVDDAQAILLAGTHPELELIGLTTVFGNVSVELATANALRLTTLLQQSIPVAQGGATPLGQTALMPPKFVHGADGFGNINWPAGQGTADSRTAAEFIIEQVTQQPGEITLIAIGPLTNLATALQTEPDLPSLVKAVIVMGGAVYRAGNVTPSAEANMICDPDAADQIFAADWPLTLVGLDVTMQLLLARSELQRLQGSRYGQFLNQSAQFYMDYYQNRIGVDGCFIHDSAAVIYAVQPDLFETAQGALLAVADGIAKGQTVFAPSAIEYKQGPWSGRPHHKVCLNVAVAECMTLFHDTLAAA